MHFQKNINIGEYLYSHVNTEDGREYATFSAHCAYFKKGKTAAETQEKICAAWGESAVTDGTCQKWFANFLGTIDILAK